MAKYYTKISDEDGNEFLLAVNITGHGAPTEDTEADPGMCYLDEDLEHGDLYKCIGVLVTETRTVYRWKKLAGQEEVERLEKAIGDNRGFNTEFNPIRHKYVRDDDYDGRLYDTACFYYQPFPDVVEPGVPVVLYRGLSNVELDVYFRPDRKGTLPYGLECFVEDPEFGICTRIFNEEILQKFTLTDIDSNIHNILSYKLTPVDESWKFTIYVIDSYNSLQTEYKSILPNEDNVICYVAEDETAYKARLTPVGRSPIAAELISDDIARSDNVIPHPDTAETGQYISVVAVDKNGKPTEYEAKNPSVIYRNGFTLYITDFKSNQIIICCDGGDLSEYFSDIDDGFYPVTVCIPDPGILNAIVHTSSGKSYRVSVNAVSDTTVTDWTVEEITSAFSLKTENIVIKDDFPTGSGVKTYSSIGLKEGSEYSITFYKTSSKSHETIYTVAKYSDELGMVGCFIDGNIDTVNRNRIYVADTQSYVLSAFSNTYSGVSITSISGSKIIPTVPAESISDLPGGLLVVTADMDDTGAMIPSHTSDEIFEHFVSGGDVVFFDPEFGMFPLAYPAPDEVWFEKSLPVDLGQGLCSLAISFIGNEIVQKMIPVNVIPTPETAEVGQTFRVSAVDENGRVTAVEAVDPYVIESSTEGSTKKFRLTVNDSGEISATEITA